MRSRWMSMFLSAVLGAGMTAFALSPGSTPFASLAEAQPAKPPPPAAKPGQGKQAVVINLKHGTDNLHATLMAYELARGMQAAGADVTIYLNLEAARLADKRQPDNLGWGATNTRLHDLQQGFLDAGGKVLVCAHCAQAVGLTAQDLRPGARIAADGEAVAAMMRADKVIDY